MYDDYGEEYETTERPLISKYQYDTSVFYANVTNTPVQG